MKVRNHAMPMYEYRCRKCDESYEQLRRMQDAELDLKCPECGGEDVERLISGFATSGACSAGGSGGFV